MRGRGGSRPRVGSGEPAPSCPRMGVCVLTAHRVGLGLLSGSGSASPAPRLHHPRLRAPAPAPRLSLSCSVVSSWRLCRPDHSPRSPPAVRMQLGGLWGAQSVRQPHSPIRECPRHPQETSRASATPPRPWQPHSRPCERRSCALTPWAFGVSCLEFCRRFPGGAQAAGFSFVPLGC